MRMHTNDANNKIIYKELSYRINGILFEVHNDLGRFCREKQYTDAIETRLKENGIVYKREELTQQGNAPDFIIDGRLVLGIKTRPFILKEHYFQTQRYLQNTGLKLGLLVNFRNRYLKPIRIIRINS